MKSRRAGARASFLVLPLLILPWFVRVAGAEFLAYVSYQTNIGPYALASGDLDGDGDEDIVTANRDSDSLSILLNNGDGTFAAALAGAAGAGPYSVAIADLNGDSRADVVSANADSGNVSVLFGNGDGTFQAPVNYAVPGPRWVALADLDGDTDLDIVAASAPANAVSVLLGNGDGTFGAAATFPVGSGPYQVTIGDFNGDFHLDIAAANRSSPFISILIGNGTGMFPDAVNYASGTSTASIVTADLDGDGDLDLVATHDDSSVVSVFLGNGDGTFQAFVDYAAGSSTRSVAIDDFDGDTVPDLGVVNWNDATLSVLRGNGNGTFQPAVNYPTGNSESGPHGVIAEDFNRDGRPDVGVANLVASEVSILLATAPDIRVTDSVPPADDLAVPFGSVEAGASAQQEVFVSNVGTDVLFYDGPITVEGEGFAFEQDLSNCSSMDVGVEQTCRIFVTFTPTGVGPFTGTLSLPTNDPDESLVTVALSGTGVSAAVPDLGVPGTVVFGGVVVGLSSEEVITVSNSGTGALGLSGISLSGNGFRIVSDDCISLPARVAARTAANGVLAMLPAGEQCTVTVAFEPTATGPHAGALQILSDDPDTPTATVALTGTGLAPIQLSGAGITAEQGGYLVNLGSLGLGGTRTVTVTVTNNGAGPIDLLSIGGGEGEFLPPFVLDTSACADGTTLDAGESCTLTVTFSPTALGSFEDFFFLDTSDPATGVLSVRVLGRGVDVTVEAGAEVLGGGGCFVASSNCDDPLAGARGAGLLVLAALAALVWGRRLRGMAAIAAVSLLLPGSVRAFDGHLFQPRPGETEFVSVRSSATLGHLGGQAGVFLDYANSPVRLDTGPGKRDLSEHQTAGTLVGALGLGDSFQVGLRVPYLFDQSGEEKDWESSASSNDLGDIELTGRYRLMGTGREGYGLAAEVSATFPTGSSDQWFGNNAFAFGGHLVLDRTWAKARAALNVGYVFTDDEDLSPDQDVDDRLTFGLGGSYRVLPSLTLGVEVYGNTTSSDAFDDRLTPVEADGWLVYSVGPAQIVAGGGTGVTVGAGAPDWRAFGGVRFGF